MVRGLAGHAAKPLPAKACKSPFQTPSGALESETGVTAITACRVVLPQQSSFMLTAIKLLQTLIWALLAGCILALPIFAVLRRFRWASIITIVVLFECVALAINGGRCPLTDFAARYTGDRTANFDIYLPIWLAEHNKFIFGTLFVVGEVVLVACWRKQRFRTSPQRQNFGSYRADRPDHDHADV